MRRPSAHRLGRVKEGRAFAAPKDVTDSVLALRAFALKSEDPALMDAWNRIAFDLSEKCVNIVLNPRQKSGKSGS
jgi:hypothetical protein